MWEYRGVKGDGERPDIVGTYSGRLVILGNSRNVWDDLDKIDTAGADTMVMGFGAFIVKDFRHAVSMHSEIIGHFNDLRYHGPLRKQPQPIWHGHRDKGVLPHTVAPKPASYIPWNLHKPFGYHAMYAARVGICLGYEEIILCGCPLDNAGCWWEPPADIYNANAYHPRPYTQEESSIKAWRDENLKGKVFSMSGATREILGAPPRE